MTSRFVAPRSPQRATGWDWIQAGLLAVNLVWTTLCLGGYRPTTWFITGALTGALFAVHCVALLVSPASGTSLPLRPALALLLFLAYALANVVWVSPVPWLGWEDWMRWAQVAVVVWVVAAGIRAAAARRALFLVLVALGLTGAALASYQRFVDPSWLMLGRVQADQFVGRSSGSFGIPNSLAGFLLLLLPMTGMLAVRRSATAVARVGWGWVTAVLVLGLVLTLSRGAWLALGAALCAWPWLQRGRRVRERLTRMIVVLAVVLTGAVVVTTTVPALQERLEVMRREAGERSRPVLWSVAWTLFREAPVLGTGAGSYDVRFEQHRPEGFHDRPQWAHNDYLNTLSDYGLVGSALLLACAVALVTSWRAPRGAPASTERTGLPPAWARDPWADASLRRPLQVGLIAFALHAFVEFHFKLPALGLAFATVAGLAFPFSTVTQVNAGPRVLRVAAGIALLATGAAAWWLGPVIRGEAARYPAREHLDRLAGGAAAGASGELIQTTERQLEQAVTLSPGNGFAWADLAAARIWRAQLPDADRVDTAAKAEAAAQRALDVSAVVPEFWIRRAHARQLLGKWELARDDLLAALQRAPANRWAWYHYAEHLAYQPNQHALALAAVETCLRLDPSNPRALALRQRLAIEASAP